MSASKGPHRSLLLTSLTNYYHNHLSDAQQLKSILDGSSPISLRILDWFVTHYAKKQNITYWLTIKKDALYYQYQPDEDIFKFNLYVDYRAQLKSYTKLLFDPFRRHERISFIIKHQPLQVIETTVGQLNFFRWIFDNHVLEYMLENLNTIEQEMATFMNQRKDLPKKIKQVPVSTTKRTFSRKGIPTIQTHHNVHLTW